MAIDAETARLADSIIMRQLEVANYTSNIDLYSQLIGTLDGGWDDDLIQFKGMDPHEAARQCPDNRLDRLAVLQQFELYSGLFKTETVECAKARSIYNVLDAKLVGPDREQALAEARARLVQ